MKYLARKLKRAIVKSWEKIDILLIGFFSKNEILASIYYLFFSKRFYLEHKAVLASRVKYYKNLNSIDSSSVLIRRNIHKLEKGIIMRPRRAVFATTYIVETVNAYATAVNNNKNDNDSSETLIWAHDVLKEYFEITDDSNPIIKKAKHIFYAVPEIKTDKNSKPYLRKFSPELTISYEDFKNLAIRRRSVRWYKDETVEREKIDKAIEIAGLSPSACNRQPFHLLIFDDKEKIESIARIPMGTKGFYHNFPGIIAVIGYLSDFEYERDRHIIYIDASLFIMPFLYTLELQGVSSCIINWPDIPQKESLIMKQLGLSKNERIIMFISYGYPDPNGMVPYSQKKNVNQLRSYNRKLHN
ncbi:MAG: nitroreductase family protein [Nanoarchaeota archaeon]